MGNIRLYGSTSGYTELAPPAVAGTSALTLPTGTGTLATQASVGLVKIVDQSFTAASSVSVNNCFTSAYTNYRILVNFVTSAGAELNLKMRASGADTSTGYYYARVQAEYNSTAINNFNSVNDSKLELSYGATTNSTALIDLFDPQLSIATSWYGNGQNRATTGNGRSFQGFIDNSTAYDGFSLIPVSGTFTGTLRVYGYQN